MEIHLKAETESRLNELASRSGRPADELVEDTMAAYLTSAGDVHNLLDGRYDDLKSGRVKPIDGEAFFGDLRQRQSDLSKRRPPKGRTARAFSFILVPRRTSTKYGSSSPMTISPLPLASVRTSFIRSASS